MNVPRLEVAEVLRQYAPEFLATYAASLGQRRVIADLIACRSASLGGHRWRCPQCGHEEVAYNSCRNRHCPKCQAGKQAEWLAAQCGNLLEASYCHIVFTLPQSLSPLVLQNQRLLYGLLFRCGAQSLLRIAADPNHLGATIGFTAILHTWGQTLMHHPHLHCVAPAGGLSPDQQRWVPARERFFLPVRVLSRLFRGSYLAGLRRAWQDGQLRLAGRLDKLADLHQWEAFLGRLARLEWVVYAKPAFGSPRQVLAYLARYTHRVAISNQRLCSLQNGQIAFRYKDYQSGARQRIMHLPAVEFIRRFLLHTLPKGFVRIRHYGFLANRVRAEKLALCRELLAKAPARTTPRNSPDHPAPASSGPLFPCPVCRQGSMLLVATVAPVPPTPNPRMNSPGYD